MQDASQELRFEDAARLRDVGRGLETIAREQRVHRVLGGRPGRSGPGPGRRAGRRRRPPDPPGAPPGTGDPSDSPNVAGRGGRGPPLGLREPVLPGSGRRRGAGPSQEVLLPVDFPDRDRFWRRSFRRGPEGRCGLLVPQRG